MDYVTIMNRKLREVRPLSDEEWKVVMDEMERPATKEQIKFLRHAIEVEKKLKVYY